MKYLTGLDRWQATLFPTCIDDLIPEDAEVRIIDLFVDALPPRELGFFEKEPTEEGRPMYHPADLFKLYVYGYLNRIRTSRLLERECQRSIEQIFGTIKRQWGYDHILLNGLGKMKASAD